MTGAAVTLKSAVRRQAGTSDTKITSVSLSTSNTGRSTTSRTTKAISSKASSVTTSRTTSPKGSTSSSKYTTLAMLNPVNAHSGPSSAAGTVSPLLNTSILSVVTVTAAPSVISTVASRVLLLTQATTVISTASAAIASAANATATVSGTKRSLTDHSPPAYLRTISHGNTLQRMSPGQSTFPYASVPKLTYSATQSIDTHTSSGSSWAA